jgi:hypothetical protein
MNTVMTLQVHTSYLDTREREKEQRGMAIWYVTARKGVCCQFVNKGLTPASFILFSIVSKHAGPLHMKSGCNLAFDPLLHIIHRVNL